MARQPAARRPSVPNILGIYIPTPDEARNNAAAWLSTQQKAFAKTRDDLIQKGRVGLERLGQAEMARQAAEQQQAQAVVRTVQRALSPKPAPRPTPPRVISASPPVTSRPANPHRGGWAEAKRNISAGVGGATDALTFGLGDKYSAYQFANMTNSRVLPSMNWLDRYNFALADLEARDRYDAENYGKARLTGQIAGTVAGVAVTGGFGAAPAGAARAVSLAPRLAEWGAWGGSRLVGPHLAAAGAGATSSLAGQGVSDVLSGQMSSPQAYSAATLGGAVGGVTTMHLGPRSGAAMEAAVSCGVESAMTGRPISWAEMAMRAGQGAYAAGAGDLAGKEWSDNLQWSKQKGPLGDWMARKQLWLEGDRSFDPQQYKRVSGGKTRVDWLTDKGHFIEAKFGYKARLSDRQLEAQAEYPELYRYMPYTPDHVGRGFGGVLGQYGAEFDPGAADDFR